MKQDGGQEGKNVTDDRGSRAAGGKKKKNRTRLRAVIPTAKEEWERGGKREDGY